MNELVITGGFDVIHNDHLEWVNQAAEIVRQKRGGISRVTVALMSNEYLTHKGELRPFFDYDWRFVDMHRLLEGLFPLQRRKVVKAEREDLLEHAGENGEVLIVSEEYKDVNFKHRNSILFAPPLNRIHTSSLEQQLLEAINVSHCHIRKVAAAVVSRYKGIVAISTNGPTFETGCDMCPKYMDIRGKYESTGEMSPSPVPCAYLHAEQSVLRQFPNGTADWLFTTTSPCDDCAEEIARSGIRRVVYLHPYHNLEPVLQLAEGGYADIRQAGINGLSFQVRHTKPAYFTSR